MTAGNGRPVHYRVDLLQTARQAVQVLGVRAKHDGTLDRFITALEFIVWRLETNPDGFGERTHHLPGLAMIVHVGAVRPVVVHFGINEKQHLVVIQSVALLSA